MAGVVFGLKGSVSACGEIVWCKGFFVPMLRGATTPTALDFYVCRGYKGNMLQWASPRRNLRERKNEKFRYGETVINP